MIKSLLESLDAKDVGASGSVDSLDIMPQDTKKVAIEIGDFLGFCDMNTEDALTSDQVEKLENYVLLCQNTHATGESLVSDAVYDRLIDILQRVNPNSDLIGRIWDESSDIALDESDSLFTKMPMYSIQTVKSYESKALIDFAKRLPKDEVDIHASFKENGWGIRLVYKDGKFLKARTRARASAGRDITPQLTEVLRKYDKLEVPELCSFPYCEIRGELLVSFSIYGRLTSEGVKSPFSAVSMLVRESATEEEWSMMDFIAYRFLAEDMDFATKTLEYEFLSDTLGFQTPASWTNTIDLRTSDFITELKGIMADCEAEEKNLGYDFFTDGVVIELDDTALARSLGQATGNYNNYNLAMKVGLWEQSLYSGYVQTILWVKGKSKLSPVAIMADSPNKIIFKDGAQHPYVYDQKEIANYDDLGIQTAAGNYVRRVPLYEPNNMLVLSAWCGNSISFKYGGEAGVVPCMPDGRPLMEGKVQQELTQDGEESDS